MDPDSLLLPFAGQGWLQVGELALAFVLASLIGLERQLRGKSAGLRTQAIVGTAAALMLLVSKYGFTDVLVAGHIVLDPSRVAAQIVSGVGFLGAGLILTRRGAVRGLTTAAAVWETAAIGMAAASGLWLLAILVTALHFVVAYGYTAIIERIADRTDTNATIDVVYGEGQGLLRQVLQAVTSAGWTIDRVGPGRVSDDGEAAVALELHRASGHHVSGRSSLQALVSTLRAVHGVHIVGTDSDEERE